MRLSFLAKILMLAFSLAFCAPASAQLTPTPSTDAAAANVVDPLGRGTPRGAVEGYLRAVAANRFDTASRFLDLSSIDEANRRAVEALRARQLKQLLDRGGYFLEINELNNSAEGSVNDGLAAEQERVGTLTAAGQEIPILLVRKDAETENGGKIWLFAQDTIKRLPFLLTVSEEGLLDRLLPDYLQDTKFAGVAVGHWLAVGLAVFAALAVGLTISWFLIAFLRRFAEKRSDVVGRGILRAINIPLGVVIAVILYRFTVLSIGIDVVARDNINWIATICMWVSIAWLGSRIVDAAANVLRHNMSLTSKVNSVAMIMLARRMAKLVIFAIAGITILDIVGVDVTTGLAALGIGGIALALGAQKTIENLVGSITVVADKPVRVGDFCQFGDVSGTVEEIGIRSTRLRTLDRTVITIPNGAFAATQIENFTSRDQFRLATTLTMRYETTPDQIRFLLVEIRALLYAHESVDNKPARVRFVNLNNHSLDIQIFAYVNASNYENFLEIQEDILLRIMDIVKGSGADFAFPSQTVYMAKDGGVSEEAAKTVEKEIIKRKKAGDLALPRFSDDQINELDGTIKLEEN